MGYKSGSYCKIWSIESINDKNTKLRGSISRKNKQTGQYETDWSGFISVFGEDAAKRAAALKEGDTIKLGDVDVSSRYDKEQKREYITFKCFGFEKDTKSPAKKPVDHGDPEPVDDAANLPF